MYMYVNSLAQFIKEINRFIKMYYISILILILCMSMIVCITWTHTLLKDDNNRHLLVYGECGGPWVVPVYEEICVHAAQSPTQLQMAQEKDQIFWHTLV